MCVQHIKIKHCAVFPNDNVSFVILLINERGLKKIIARYDTIDNDQTNVNNYLVISITKFSLSCFWPPKIKSRLTYHE